MHNIIEIEKKLKEQYAKDKSDPLLYVLLKELTEGILVTKKLFDNSTDIDYVSHEVATDIYLKLNDKNKNFEIYAWTRYIMRSIKGYINYYLYYNRNKQQLLIEDPVDYRKFVKDNYPELFPVKYNELRDIINDIPEIILEFYNKNIRYYKDSELYKNTLISLYLSIYYDKLYVYKNTDKDLLLFLYRMLIKTLSSIILSNEDHKFFNYDNIKLFELNVSGGNDFD